MNIPLKTEQETELIREAGRIVAAVLKSLGEMARPGVTTGEMLDRAGEVMDIWGGEPVFPPEAGFPAAICTSVNEQVVHGIPGDRVLREGDIVSVDVGVRYKGYIADAARTFPVGEISGEARSLLNAGEQSLSQALNQCKEGNRLQDIGRAVQQTAEKAGFSVVREFVGHGVGRKLHEPPQVPNYVPIEGNLGETVLRRGMVIAVEPMLNAGTFHVKWLDDGWTVVTADGELSCHFEHTIAVGDDAGRVLTAP